MSLPRSPRLAIVLRSAALFALMAGGTQGCTPGNQGVDDPGRPTDSDMGAATDPEMGPSKPCGSGGTPCPSGRICYMDQCIPDNGTCCTDDHCQNDTHCSVKGPADGGMSCGVCIAYKDGERDPMCSGNGFSASEFKPPVDRCRWPAPGATPVARDVVMTPVVVDLDGDGQPEIVFGPQSSSGPMRLVAIRGTDCSVLYDVSANLEGFSQIAAGDLDGDGRPEIVGLLASGTASSGHPVGVFNGRTGALITQSSESFMMINAAFDCSGPAIADLDGDGQPEVVVGGLALRYNRARRTLDTMWNKAVPASTWGTLSLVNDMDGDGRPEVISACSKASLACWKARRGRWTQMADSSTKWLTPNRLASSSTFRCARWSIAHASLGAPVREAMHDTIASNVSPPNPSRTIDALSVMSTCFTAAPSRSGRQPVDGFPRWAPVRGLTKQTTSCPRCTSAATVARPIVPVAPRTQTRCRASAFGMPADAVAAAGDGCVVFSVPLTMSLPVGPTLLRPLRPDHPLWRPQQCEQAPANEMLGHVDATNNF